MVGRNITESMFCLRSQHFSLISHCGEKNNPEPLCYLLFLFHVFVHDVIVLCSPLDYFPTLHFFRRLPHLDAPLMITTSVSNINVSVQLGDTTPFALGFLSANAGTAGLLHAACVHTHRIRQVNAR